MYTPLTIDILKITMIRLKMLGLEAKLGLYKMPQEDDGVDTLLGGGRGFIHPWECLCLSDSANPVCFSAISYGL